MLILVLLFPLLYLFSQLLLDLILFLVLPSKLGDISLKLVDLDVLNLCILLGPKILHSGEQLLLLPFDLDVISRHVFILVLLKHF